jgi:hypothetical protein
VLRFIAEIADHVDEPMLILPKYEFDNYLVLLTKMNYPGTTVYDQGRSPPSGQGTQQPLTARDLFPFPKTSDGKTVRGDFDVLIVSPRFGLVVIETKTMLGKDSTSPHTSLSLSSLSSSSQLSSSVSRSVDQDIKSEPKHQDESAGDPKSSTGTSTVTGKFKMVTGPNTMTLDKQKSTILTEEQGSKFFAAVGNGIAINITEGERRN